MSEIPEVTVEVEVPASEPPTETPVVVVAEADSIGSVDLDHERRITALESNVDSLLTAVENLSSAAASAQLSADIATEIASDAVDTAEAAVEDAHMAVEAEMSEPEFVPVPEDDIIPETAKVHPFFRSFSDWRRK